MITAQITIRIAAASWKCGSESAPPRWNYMVRLYRPRRVIIEGAGHFRPPSRLTAEDQRPQGPRKHGAENLP